MLRWLMVQRKSWSSDCEAWTACRRWPAGLQPCLDQDLKMITSTSRIHSKATEAIKIQIIYGFTQFNSTDVFIGLNSAN